VSLQHIVLFSLPEDPGHEDDPEVRHQVEASPVEAGGTTGSRGCSTNATHARTSTSSSWRPRPRAGASARRHGGAAWASRDRPGVVGRGKPQPLSACGDPAPSRALPASEVC